MGLGVYTTEYNGYRISEDGDFDAPIIVKVPPSGGTGEMKLYLRHEKLSGVLAESSYDVIVEAADDYDVDNSSWITVAPDVSGSAGTYVSSLDVGDILVGNIVPFWLKYDIPDTPSTGVVEDIYLHVQPSSTSQTLAIDLSEGEYFESEYDVDEEKIKVDTSVTPYSYWISRWYDISNYDEVYGLSKNVEGSVVVTSMRTSSDETEDTATAWFNDIDEVDLTNGYIQFRVEFYKSADIDRKGMAADVYGNTDFSVYRNHYPENEVPVLLDVFPQHPRPKSVTWDGYFVCTTEGTHSFRLDSYDGHRLVINDIDYIDDWATGQQNNTISVYLTQGYHKVHVEYFDDNSSTEQIYMYVTPPSQSQRLVTVNDFKVVQPVVALTELKLHFRGAKTLKFDIQLYDGPDVPEHIDPESGYETPFFRPELTVYQRNCAYVEFQMDTDPNFSTEYLTSFIVPTDPDGLGAAVEGTIVGQAENGQRPHGIWYWRARGITNGIYSAWSDWWIIEILELVANDSFLYFNVNVSLETEDPTDNDRYLYLNANVGLNVHDPIVDDRFLYQNVNVDTGIGKVIYPFYDDTRTRKLEFDEDEEFEQGEE